MDVGESAAPLRELADSFPRPVTCHPGAERVAEIFADLEAAVAAVLADAAAQGAFAAELERPAPIGDEAGLSPAAARERLSSASLPEGEHPYADLVRPTIEALGRTLAAIARRQSAAGLFERTRPGVRVALDVGASPVEVR